tara:strand:+ start:1362 stop:2336 length:975 start_codon:yes stop_codon:yes gene_type:complete
VKQIHSQNHLSELLKEKAKEEGFNPVGIAKVPGSRRIKLRTAALERWLEAGHHSDMNWMKAERRRKIEALLEGVSSVLAVGLNYYVDKERKPNSLLIGRYAWGKDYHEVIETRLKRIGKWLESQRPKCKWRVCVDSSALLEKAWAEEAGIGWIAKNSNVINQVNGSWMVLGFLLCTEPLVADSPSDSLCGKCQKCIDICPTKAITEPFVINANRCLAYHTIENKEQTLPLEITSSMGNWIAGCDICQDVCPWNQKQIPSNNDPEVQPKNWILNLTKEESLKWSDEEWKENLKDSSLKRIKPWMWRRNINAINKKSSKVIKNNYA